MFNQVITTFQGFFSRSYWFGSFLPVAVACSLHLLILELAFPETNEVWSFVKEGFASTVSLFAVSFAALVILAYALTPITPVVRDMLDGRLLPNWLHDHLRKARISKRLDSDERLNTLNLSFLNFVDLRERIPELWEAARRGNTQPDKSNPATIDTAQRALSKIEGQVEKTLLPKIDETRLAFIHMAEALRTNPSNRNTPKEKELDMLQMRLIALLKEAAQEADYRLERALTHSPEEVLRPTRIGDARQVAEAYSQVVYHVEFDYLWPRIQILVPESGDDFGTRLGDAQSRVNFAVLTLALILTIPALWLPLAIALKLSPGLFLVVGLVSPILVLFFHEMVVQSQNMLGRLTQVAIDKYRLRVLTEIAHQPMPTTLAEERRLWEGLMSASSKQGAKDFVVLVNSPGGQT